MNKKIKASTMMEAIVSIALISAIMLIVFPFFGQLLESNHELEIMKGLRLMNEMESAEGYDPLTKESEEFSEDGLTVRVATKQDDENPMLYLITTELVNVKNKVVYSLSEFKYRP